MIEIVPAYCERCGVRLYTHDVDDNVCNICSGKEKSNTTDTTESESDTAPKNITSTVQVNPTGKSRPRIVRVRGRSVTYTPERTMTAEKKIWAAAKIARVTKLTGPVAVELDFFFPAPGRWTKKKRLELAQGLPACRPEVKPDCDNLAKLVLDSLNGVAYEDDKQVVSLRVAKWWIDAPPDNSGRRQGFVRVSINALSGGR